MPTDTSPQRADDEPREVSSFQPPRNLVKLILRRWELAKDFVNMDSMHTVPLFVNTLSFGKSGVGEWHNAIVPGVVKTYISQVGVNVFKVPELAMIISDVLVKKIVDTLDDFIGNKAGHTHESSMPAKIVKFIYAALAFLPQLVADITCLVGDIMGQAIKTGGKFLLDVISEAITTPDMKKLDNERNDLKKNVENFLAKHQSKSHDESNANKLAMGSKLLEYLTHPNPVVAINFANMYTTSSQFVSMLKVETSGKNSRLTEYKDQVEKIYSSEIMENIRKEMASEQRASSSPSKNDGVGLLVTQEVERDDAINNEISRVLEKKAKELLIDKEIPLPTNTNTPAQKSTKVDGTALPLGSSLPPDPIPIDDSSPSIKSTSSESMPIKNSLSACIFQDLNVTPLSDDEKLFASLAEISDSVDDLSREYLDAGRSKRIENNINNKYNNDNKNTLPIKG